MKIEDVSFPVTVLLGKATIPLKAYSELRLGDILILDQLVEKGVSVKVGMSERYLATAGLFEAHKAIIIDAHIQRQ